jgi:hypothetical protein
VVDATTLETYTSAQDVRCATSELGRVWVGRSKQRKEGTQRQGTQRQGTRRQGTRAVQTDAVARSTRRRAPAPQYSGQARHQIGSLPTLARRATGADLPCPTLARARCGRASGRELR